MDSPISAAIRLLVQAGGLRQKEIYFVRHGKGVHNALAELYRKQGKDVEQAYTQPDGNLTPEGREACTYVCMPDVDLVIVSPITRAIQTAQIVFRDRNVPMIAMEEPRENPYKYSINRRAKRSELEKEYPHINFSALTEDDLMGDGPENVTVRIKSLYNILLNRPEKKIAVVSHHNFIKYFMARFGMSVSPVNCGVYKVVIC